jgi:hypothetical protein
MTKILPAGQKKRRQSFISRDSGAITKNYLTPVARSAQRQAQNSSDTISPSALLQSAR